MKTQKIKISELDDDLDTEASLKCMNMKKTLGISVDKNQKIKLKIDMKNKVAESLVINENNYEDLLFFVKR